MHIDYGDIYQNLGHYHNIKTNMEESKRQSLVHYLILPKQVKYFYMPDKFTLTSRFF